MDDDILTELEALLPKLRAAMRSIDERLTAVEAAVLVCDEGTRELVRQVGDLVLKVNQNP